MICPLGSGRSLRLSGNYFSQFPVTRADPNDAVERGRSGLSSPLGLYRLARFSCSS
jgi:hypothetical protein